MHHPRISCLTLWYVRTCWAIVLKLWLLRLSFSFKSSKQRNQRVNIIDNKSSELNKNISNDYNIKQWQILHSFLRRNRSFDQRYHEVSFLFIYNNQIRLPKWMWIKLRPNIPSEKLRLIKGLYKKLIIISTEYLFYLVNFENEED